MPERRERNLEAEIEGAAKQIMLRLRQSEFWESLEGIVDRAFGKRVKDAELIEKIVTNTLCAIIKRMDENNREKSLSRVTSGRPLEGGGLYPWAMALRKELALSEEDGKALAIQLKAGKAISLDAVCSPGRESVVRELADEIIEKGRGGRPTKKGNDKN